MFNTPLQWRHSEHKGVSNHLRPYCLFNGLLRHRSKKTAKLRVTCLCEWNPLVTDESVAFDDVIMSTAIVGALDLYRPDSGASHGRRNDSITEMALSYANTLKPMQNRCRFIDNFCHVFSWVKVIAFRSNVIEFVPKGAIEKKAAFRCPVY